jgi:ribosomal protein S18 acetylase RimI-like enzyme
LVRAAVNYVKENETVPAIYLTSNPSRVAARSLYMSEGFEEYNTGVFRMTQK